MANPIESARQPAVRRLLPITATRPGRAIARRVAALASWARLTNGALRLGAADAVSPLDAQSRALLWYVLTETISTIGTLAATDTPPDTCIAALQKLADRVGDRVALAPPRAAASMDGAEPPQIFVLGILTHDLRPCLARWLPRLAERRDSARSVADWPLARFCCTDLTVTRERLIERCWQLGMALAMPSLGRLLPERPAAVPTLTPPTELAAAEVAAAAPLDPGSLEAGWRIYVEAAAILAAPCFPCGPGALGESIVTFDAFAGEIRAALKATSPAPAHGTINAIQSLVLGLLIEEVQPFLVKWRPRYRRFAASGRSEAKWRRCEECRSDLAATRDRCRSKVLTLGEKIGAPPFPDCAATTAVAAEEVRLQLPAPEMRP
jgi:hypothetical protein